AHSVRDQAVDAAFVEAMRTRGVWQFAETLSREASMFIYGAGAPFLNDPFFARAASQEIRARLGSEEYRASVVNGAHYHDYSDFFETAQANVARLAAGGVN